MYKTMQQPDRLLSGKSDLTERGKFLTQMITTDGIISVEQYTLVKTFLEECLQQAYNSRVARSQQLTARLQFSTMLCLLEKHASHDSYSARLKSEIIQYQARLLTPRSSLDTLSLSDAFTPAAKALPPPPPRADFISALSGALKLQARAPGSHLVSPLPSPAEAYDPEQSACAITTKGHPRFHAIVVFLEAMASPGINAIAQPSALQHAAH